MRDFQAIALSTMTPLTKSMDGLYTPSVEALNPAHVLTPSAAQGPLVVEVLIRLGQRALVSSLERDIPEHAGFHG